MDRHTPRTRDAALRKLRAANRWLIAGSVTMTGIFTAVAASAFPGKTIKSGSTPGTSAGRAGTGSSRLRAPARSPQTSEQEGSGEAEKSTESEGAKTEKSTESAAGAEAEGSAEPERVVEPEKTVEAEKQVEAETKVETQPEAPVVSGGS